MQWAQSPLKVTERPSTVFVVSRRDRKNIGFHVFPVPLCSFLTWFLLLINLFSNLAPKLMVNCFASFLNSRYIYTSVSLWRTPYLQNYGRGNFFYFEWQPVVSLPVFFKYSTWKLSKILLKTISLRSWNLGCINLGNKLKIMRLSQCNSVTVDWLISYSGLTKKIIFKLKMKNRANNLSSGKLHIILMDPWCQLKIPRTMEWFSNTQNIVSFQIYNFLLNLRGIFVFYCWMFHNNFFLCHNTVQMQI
jgi:hypothetical protein